VELVRAECTVRAAEARDAPQLDLLRGIETDRGFVHD
jgi:hypothetical protein